MRENSYYGQLLRSTLDVVQKAISGAVVQTDLASALPVSSVDGSTSASHDQIWLKVRKIVVMHGKENLISMN